MLIRDLVLIDLECGNMDGVRFEFVVPTEVLGLSRQAEYYIAFRNRNHLGINGRSCSFGWVCLGNLTIDGQLMEHVSERLKMHQAVLDGNVQKNCQRKAVPT